MTVEVKVPLLPESISDATVSTWHKKVGDKIARDENLVDLETDKVMLEVPAPAEGVIKEILFKTGATVKAQDVIAIIESEGSGHSSPEKKSEDINKPEKTASISQVNSDKANFQKENPEKNTAALEKAPEKKGVLSPSARRAAAELEVDASKIEGTGKDGRVTKDNIIANATSSEKSEKPSRVAETSAPKSLSNREEKRVPMTRIRTRIAERLLEVTQNTAMLTTFNEVNMSAVMDLRSRYKDSFEKKYKIRLGFMSFFVKACVEALKRSPVVNASIDGNDIVYHGYFDVGVAVSTERGLVVPVIRDADQLSMAEIEMKISAAAEKARTGKLTMEEMQGGTFTITNGGVFGSLMATPIINAPQCAILGMHKIQERPVAEKGQVVIRPMMYLALSYDHRLIDGKESVTFLVTIKELLEDPSRLLLEV